MYIVIQSYDRTRYIYNTLYKHFHVEFVRKFTKLRTGYAIISIYIDDLIWFIFLIPRCNALLYISISLNFVIFIKVVQLNNIYTTKSILFQANLKLYSLRRFFMISCSIKALFESI